MKENLKLALAIILFLGFVAGSAYFNFYIWRAKHPQAPTWTFFFKD